MGSDETATATTGAPQKIGVLTGTGRHRAQIIYFFRMLIGSRTSSGIGLRLGGRLRRMRRCLGLPRELWIQNFGDLGQRAAHCHAPCLYVSADGSGRARGVGVCPRLVATLGDHRATSGPRIDWIQSTGPSWWPVPRIEKNTFLGPQYVSH